MSPVIEAVPLYVSNGGRVTCASHGGGYLESEVRANPRRKNIVTPLDYWTRISADDVAFAEQEGDADLWTCETCNAPAAV